MSTRSGTLRSEAKNERKTKKESKAKNESIAGANARAVVEGKGCGLVFEIIVPN